MARGIAGILSEQYDGIDKLGWAPGRIEIQTAAPITERDLLTPGAFHIMQATCGRPSAFSLQPSGKFNHGRNTGRNKSGRPMTTTTRAVTASTRT